MKTEAKSLICNHKRTKPKLFISGRIHPTYGYRSVTERVLCCVACGEQVPETPQYLERQVAYG